MKQFPHAAMLALNNLPVPRELLIDLATVEFRELIHAAWRIRARYHYNAVSCCGIVNARSGQCSEDCAFCAQSAHHKAVIEKYPALSPARLVAAAKKTAKLPVDHVGIVTSGRSLAPGPERERLIKGIRAAAAAIRVPLHVSLGTLDDEVLMTLKDCGVTRIHHNLETSRRFFPAICTTHSYDDRVSMIKRAIAAGFEVCCGGLFGLGETWEDRVDLALELRALGVLSVPLNFLMPIPGTPMAKQPPMAPRDALRIIAMFRFAMPTADLRICGGRSTVLRDLQSWIFAAGATSMMIGNYLTTPGRDAAQDLQMIEDLGLRGIPVQELL